MTNKEPLITDALLEEWEACWDVHLRFNELMPEGETLPNAINALIKDGHDDWAKWLFDRCKNNNLYESYTAKGYQGTGNYNSGERNSGERNTGRHNTGRHNTGDYNAGDYNAGDKNTGDFNAGYWNTGGKNTGHRNTGDYNAGDKNTGRHNTGYENTGNWNTGDGNTGRHNTGNCNAGYWNTGDGNTGNYNTGSFNTGHFNTETPENIRVFNKDVERNVWDAAYKPEFLCFGLTEWVEAKNMSQGEKQENPEHVGTLGYLRPYGYKEAFQKSWDEADPRDRIKIKDLPNFDADIFYEISGIDLREAKECAPEVIELNGVKYVRADSTESQESDND